MGDDREPPSSEELIRRAREGYSTPDSPPDEPRAPEPHPAPEPPVGGPPLDDDPEPAAEHAMPEIDEPDLPPAYDPPSESDAYDEPERDYEPEPANEAGPEARPEAAPGTGHPIEDAEPIEHPSWLPDSGYPGGTVPAPSQAPSGFARFFSIGRWVLGGIFLLVALGQCVGSETTLDDLTIGECFQDPGLGVEVSEVETIDCNELHDFELYATVALGASERIFPGSETLFTELESECVARFSGYVGHDYLTSAYDFVAFTPVEEGWRDGDRTGMCAIYEFGDAFEIVGSIGTARNSGR
jgi:hypothetical protein